MHPDVKKRIRNRDAPNILGVGQFMLKKRMPCLEPILLIDKKEKAIDSINFGFWFFWLPGSCGIKGQHHRVQRSRKRKID